MDSDGLLINRQSPLLAHGCCAFMRATVCLHLPRRGGSIVTIASQTHCPRLLGVVLKDAALRGSDTSAGIDRARENRPCVKFRKSKSQIWVRKNELRDINESNLRQLKIAGGAGVCHEIVLFRCGTEKQCVNAAKRQSLVFLSSPARKQAHGSLVEATEGRGRHLGIPQLNWGHRGVTGRELSESEELL